MQKVMETIFETIYLLFAFSSSILIVIKAFKNNNNSYFLFGLGIFLLGFGDSFHLIPRMVGLNTTGLDDYVFSLGLGKLITSITMTIFYIVMYFYFEDRYNKKLNPKFECLYFALALIRIILCAMPSNEWFESSSSYLWGIIRNIPFVIMGIIFIIISYKWCKKDTYFKYTYLLVSLSFVFYLLTVLVAPFVSIMGLMMLPKTVCYILFIICGLRAIYLDNNKKEISL